MDKQEGTSTVERGLFGAVGVGIALVSGLFAVMFAVEMATGGDGKTTPAVYAGLVVFFTGAFLGGTYLAWRMLRKRQTAAGAARPGAASSGAAKRSRGRAAIPDAAGLADPAAADAEQRVLLLAEKEHGRLTLAEVAAHCDLTVAEAKTVLDRMVLQEVAVLHVTDGGVLVYVFDGFLSDSEKARAQDF